MTSKREETVEAVRCAIDPSIEGNYRDAFERAAKAIRAMPLGTFTDETQFGTFVNTIPAPGEMKTLPIREIVNAERTGRTVRNVVDAIEAFVSARITYEDRLRHDPGWASLNDVSETREQVQNALGELVNTCRSI